MQHIETERLILRQFTLDDWDEHTQIYRHPEVTKYSPKGSVPPEKAREASKAILDYFIQHWQQHGFGAWAVIEGKSGKLIGQAGLNFLPESPEVEVLYRFDPAYWGRGIATEATKACLRYGFEILQLDHIVAITKAEHLASRRVMEKAGLHYEKDAYFYNLEVVYYRISRTDYRPDCSPYRVTG